MLPSAIPTADPFDYTTFIRRTDPTACPACIDIHDLGDIDVAAAYTGGFAAELPVVAGIWRQVSPDPDTTAGLLAVLAVFVEAAQDNGYARFSDVMAGFVAGFVRSPCEDPAMVWPLRKNAVHGAYLALRDAGLLTDSPAAGVDTTPAALRTTVPARAAKGQPRRKPYDKRVHARPATNDEILLTRLATRLAGSSRARHLPAAAVAICSASAVTSEAAQVLWRDLHPADTPTTVDLPGRRDAHGRTELDIAARTVTLDGWQRDAVGAWRRENAAQRPILPGAAVLYGGRQATTSNSAQVGVDNQIGKALTIADLDDQTGLTANSFRLWAAARHVTDRTSLDTGAAIAGVAPLTLHRHIHQLGERRLLLAG